MKDALIASIATFHMKKIITSDPVKFHHNGSIPESMYRSVTPHSKVMADYSKIHPTKSGVLTTEQQAALDALDKPSNRGKRVTTKKETTEHKPSIPSKSKKRKSDTESSSKPMKIKRMARKPKSPSTLQSDNEDDEEAASPHVSPRGDTPPRSPSLTQEVNIPTPPPSRKQSPPKPEDVKIPTPPPSPKQTTPPPKQPTPTPTPKVLVSVIPTTTTETSLPPPPVSSLSISITPFSTPIITPFTTTTIPEQTTRVNVSNTGAPTVSDTPVITIPPSPTQSTGSGATLGGDNDEYVSTYFSPYRLQSDEDTEAPINHQHLASIHEKLDKLLADTQAYGGVVLKAFVETAIEQYKKKTIDKSTDAIKESTSVCQKASADVTEVIRTTHIFLDSLKGHADTNSATLRESVASLSRSLKEEHKKFEEVRSSIQVDNASLISLVSSKLDSLHADISNEGALKEEIARQASTIAVQHVQLAQVEKEISLLKTERAVFRSCANDVKDMLTNILGADDPILTLTIHNHLQPNFFPPLLFFMK
ncbi:flocculation protein FLO11-like [Lactuca sativa]|uniref:flocculation protein FLO11-like n=1 Tax=Lactuca sativa TaxID=4236 RepID=UPI000CD90BE1|nr:flocculation protein FLO11-like [Lactuca sativa]